MVQSELKLADPEKVRLAQENLIAYYRVFAGVQGICFVETATCTWNATAEGAPGNQVLRARFDAASADGQIADLVRQLGRYGDHFDWFVFPSCQPHDLKQRVEAYGLAGGPDGQWELHGTIGGLGGTWMLMDLEDLAPEPPMPRHFHIEPVGDDAQLEIWRQASCAGFEGGPYDNFYTAYSRHGFATDAFVRHYIGFLDQRPVTSATLLLTEGMASIYNVSTPPSWRGRGFGTAISWFMLKEAKDRNCREAFVWSSPLGRNVYQRVGFAIWDFGMREYQWRKRTSNA